MRGVEANTDALRLAHSGNDEGEMLESMTDARTLPGRGLKRDLRSHVGNSAKHLVDGIDNFLHTSFFACAEVRARMQHQKWQFKLVRTTEFFREGANRICVKLRIRRSEVDEVIRVPKDRRQLASLDMIEKRADFLAGQWAGNPCILVFTNICMAVASIETRRPIAMLAPARMDMCAPRRIGRVGESVKGRVGEDPVSPRLRFAVSFLFTTDPSEPLGANRVF